MLCFYTIGHTSEYLLVMSHLFHTYSLRAQMYFLDCSDAYCDCDGAIYRLVAISIVSCFKRLECV